MTEIPSQSHERASSSWVFEKAMKANTGFVADVKQIIGKENVEELPDGTNPVIAVSHLGSDTMLQVAATVLADSFKLSFAAHKTGAADRAFRFMLNHMLDIKLYGITATLKKGKGIERYGFHPQDYTEMIEAMRRGETIITSGNPPTKDGTLPSYGGISSVYLAQKSMAEGLNSNAVVIPVLIDFHTNEPIGRMDQIGKTIVTFVKRKRPQTSIIIGGPIHLDPIPKDDLSKFDERYSSHYSFLWDDEERSVTDRVHQTLKQQAGQVMEFYASHLPEERRGRWSQNIPTLE